MSTLFVARDLSKSFGSQTLFDGVGLQLSEGERLGVIGPNGSGKSTLLKILAGLEQPDAGEITLRRGIRQVYVGQHDEFASDATPLSAVRGALHAQDGLDHRIDNQTRASIALSQLGFEDCDQPVSTMSGGWWKRLSIACAIVQEPDVLMLDEPTNHLDLGGVLWLERFVMQAGMAVVIITHDRQFLENVATRIVEIATAYPNRTFSVAGNYTDFVRRKDEFLSSQLAAEATMANRVRRDTAWLEQGVQARRTRNKTQVQASVNRRAELKSLSARNKSTSRTTAIDFQATDRRTNILLTFHHVCKIMGGRPLFESLDMTLSPGKRIGVLGENGSGKTTLLRLVTGECEPDSGTIKRADQLRVVSFTQDRAELDRTQTLKEALCPVGDTVHYRDKPMHVSGWAQKFLFSADQLGTAVSALSGGEKARVLLARLMLQPADILLLDEPTNDLDIPSMEVLEQAVLEFPGAVLLVSHDRFMLERLSTEYLSLNGLGQVTWHASFEQWEKRAVPERVSAPRSRPSERKSAADQPKKASGAKKKLSFKLQRECDGMEDAIIQAEQELATLEAAAADPNVVSDHLLHADACRRLAQAHERVDELYARWAELEAMQ